ncbi:MAG: hypothetical protein ACTSU9_01800, partial [Promethearchaeota archaeon]
QFITFLCLVTFIPAFLVPLEIFLRSRNFYLEFTTFDWTFYGCCILIPFILNYVEKIPSIRKILAGLVGMAITCTLSFIFLPVMDFPMSFQRIVTFMGVETQIGAMFYSLILFWSLLIFSSSIKFFQGMASATNTPDTANVMITIAFSLIIAGILSLFVLSLVNTSHAVLVLGASSSSAGAFIIGYDHVTIKNHFTRIEQARLDVLKKRKTGKKDVDVTRAKKAGINVPTMIFSWISFTAVVAGGLFIYCVTLQEDREVILMSHLVINIITGASVALVMWFLAVKFEVIKLVNPVLQGVALAILLWSAVSGDFYDPVARFSLVGIATMVSSLSFLYASIKYERNGLTGLLFMVTWLGAGGISGIAAHAYEIMGLYHILMIVILGITVLDLSMLTLRHFLHKMVEKNRDGSRKTPC